LMVLRAEALRHVDGKALCKALHHAQHQPVEPIRRAHGRQRLHAERVLWLHHGGLERDDTDAHIDTLARFAPNNTIVYGEGSEEMLEELKSFRTLKGEPYRLVAVPPYYANFLIMNGAILLPFYEDPNENQRAKEALEVAFPDREVIGIDCSILLTQNGSLHCCTMQYPESE
ncbi:MAG: agmatine deiminase family protein, partial [Bacteroidaceae bacterium]|nr:agmatine deiminase family protein [Bacteroidaceae bacterium]